MENTVFITSLVNCNPSRTIYSRKDRFLQTKFTIQTVREKIPNSFIILIDITDFTQEERDFFNSSCDIVINEYNSEIAKKCVFEHPNKSYGERYYLLRCFEELISRNIIHNVKNIYKVSGRYYLDNKFNYDDYNNDKTVVKIVDEKLWKNACTTCLFKLSIKDADIFFNSLFHKEHFFLNGHCMEHFMYLFITSFNSENYINLLNLGMSGLVTHSDTESSC